MTLRDERTWSLYCERHLSCRENKLKKTITLDTGNSFFFKTTSRLMYRSLHQVIDGKHQNKTLCTTWMTLTTLKIALSQLNTCLCNLNNTNNT